MDTITNQNTIYDYMGNFPYFTPEEMDNLGVFGNHYYDYEPDNIYINDKISSKMWYESYKLFFNGLCTEEYENINKLRIEKLYELYSDYCDILDSHDSQKINSRKQSILELGWNPEIGFRNSVRKIKDNKIRYNIKRSLLEEINVDINLEYLDESKVKKFDNCKPIYILLTFTDTLFGNVIKRATHCNYTHVALSLDSSLNNLYSFNARARNDSRGFSLEDIKYYNQADNCSMCLYAVFIDNSKFDKLKNDIKEYIESAKDTSYSFLTALGIALNRPIEINNSMICSQFVDTVLKGINLELTKKQSALVAPADFYKIKDRRMIKVYEGKIKDYKKSKTDNIIKYISTDKKVVNEAKEFPVGFDKEGNLLIKNIKKLNYEEEYQKTHKLLLNYEKAGNYYAMSYEICKLWFLNTELEKKIYQSNLDKDTKDKLYKTRARVLNDFNKYLKEVQKYEKSFNFSEYYNNTPFSDASIKIDKYTIEYTGKLIKSLII